MIHILYKTTRFDGKYYIGVHSTEDVDDGYLGSGKHLQRSLKKYGKAAHVRQILETFETLTEAYAAEREAVTILEVKDRNCMNIALGGKGGMPGEMNGFYGKKHSPETRAILREKNRGRVWSAGTRQKISHKFKGVSLSEEHRLKLKAANVGKVQNHSHESIAKREAAKMRSIVLDGVRYESIKAAAEALGTYREKISRMLKGI